MPPLHRMLLHVVTFAQMHLSCATFSNRSWYSEARNISNIYVALSHPFSRPPFSQLLSNSGPYPALSLVLITIYVNIFYLTLFSVEFSSSSLGSFFPDNSSTQYTSHATENHNNNTYI